MGYMKFTKQRRPSDDTKITLLKWGQLGISRSCTDKYFKGYKFALLYFDEAQRKIGIQPTNEASNDACNIRFIKKGTLATISIIQFLNHFEIDHEQSVVYNATWNDEAKLVEISLKQPKN